MPICASVKGQWNDTKFKCELERAQAALTFHKLLDQETAKVQGVEEELVWAESVHYP